jgi:uroporphyrinogen-III decarboxylase
MANILLVMAKALAKGKFKPAALTGLERFMLAQFTVPDRVPTMLAATNVEPALIDPKFNYKLLASSVEANLELFARVKERFQFDVVSVPTWLGLMLTGVAELGVGFTIDEERVPYASSHPIHGIEDVRRITPVAEPSGYFKMTLEINREAQRRFSDTMINFMNDGPWDLAMLMRGDKQLPLDFRIYKDYVETQDPLRKEKIKKYGDPDLWPAIMELTTRLSTQIFILARQSGVNMLGAAMVDQFAAEPVLSIDDFIKHVLPYSEKARKDAGKGIGMGYMVSSPQKLEGLLDHPILGKALGMAGFTNYIFPTLPNGVTLPDHDEPMFKLAQKVNRSYMYMVHAKFTRDASGEQIEEVVKRICGMATSMRVRAMISVGAIAPGTDLKKIDVLLDAVHKYGRYSR